MANTKSKTLNNPKKLLFIMALALSAVIFWHAPKAAAACAAPPTNMGTVTSTTSVATSGTYRIWSRIMSGTASTDNSYYLEIDGGTCYQVGNLSTMPTGSWQWVDYQAGTTTNKVNATLSAGTHTIKMIGVEDGVKVDRIILTTDTTCVPTGTGDNCVTAADTTNPTASITAPSTGAKVKGTVTVNANASDDSGTVTKVELYVDGVMVGSADTTAPYSFSWNTTSTSAGSHNLMVKAYDASNNVGNSASISVTVDNTGPTVSLTAPVNGATLAGTVNIAANASDNFGITSVDFYRGSTLLASDTTSPYSYSWNTTSVADGNYTLTAKANDGSGNTTTSSAVTVTVKNSVVQPDTTPPTTSITAPSAGATLTGATNSVTANASDNVGVAKVELYVSGLLVATDVASPYSFNLDTTGMANGSYTLTTKAYDAAGNSASSVAVTININNGSNNPGDVNGDGHDTIIDLSILLTNYGATNVGRSAGDLDGNGSVNILDLSRLLTYYGS